MKYILIALSLTLAGCGVDSSIENLKDVNKSIDSITDTMKKVNKDLDTIQENVNKQNKIFKDAKDNPTKQICFKITRPKHLVGRYCLHYAPKKEKK
jgi:uncharacterized protein YoxC